MNSYIKAIKDQVDYLYNTVNNQGELSLANRCSLLNNSEFDNTDAECIFIRNLFFKECEYNCAKYTINIWKEEFSEQQPQNMLVNAYKALYDEDINNELVTRLNNLQTYLENKLCNTPPNLRPSIYAGFSCWAASRSILFGIDSIEFEETDLTVNLDSWMASFISSLAFARQIEADKLTSTMEEKRKEFWIWFLNDCIPSAISNIGF